MVESMSKPDDEVTFFVEKSPCHYERTSKFLKALRERGDTRTCDMVFLLSDGGRERLHSGLAGGHSGKMAKIITTADRMPLTVDMSNYPAAIVTKVIDWMYNGTLGFQKAHVGHYLRVANILGTVFLHRLLERTLCELANEGFVIEAINIATHKETGVSSNTSIAVLEKLCERQEIDPVHPDDVLHLTLRSVICLVKARVTQTMKAPLINMVLFWLRHPEHVHLTTDVLSRLKVKGMTDEAITALRNTLFSALRNPNLRRYVFVSIRNGWLAINVKPVEMWTPAGTDVSGSEDEAEGHRNSGSQAAVGKYMKTQSEKEEYGALPPDELVFGNPEYHTGFTGCGMHSSGGLVTCWERPKERSFTTSELEDIKKLPDVFPWKHPRRSYSKAEIDEIKKLPNVFKLPRERSFTNTDLEHIHQLPDVFSQQYGLPKTRSFTNTEVEEIKKLPNMFGRDRKGLRDFTMSERLEIRNLPDMFEKRKKQRSYTRSEAEDIRNLPDMFEEERLEKEMFIYNSFRTKKYRSFTRSEVEHIHNLPDVFETEKSKKQRSFTHSEMDDIRKLPVSFSTKKEALVDCCNDCQPIPSPVRVALDDFDGASTAQSISGPTLADLQRNSDGGKKSETPKKANSSYANLPKGTWTNSYYAF